MTEMNERFIPLHMMYERIAPEEPTSAPVMISAELPSVKPMPAAGHPEYEVSIEITTRMSAPPIGTMISTPNRNAASASSQNAKWLSVRTDQTTIRQIATNSARLMTWRSGKRIGAPLMRADNFRNAMTEPVKVIAPIAAPSDISTKLDLWMSPGTPMSNARGA